jgi:hypothetical protein
MNLLIWRVHQWARRLGRSGIAGVALLLVAAVMQFGQVAALDAETASLETRLASLRVVSAAAPDKTAVPVVGFIDALPDTAVASGVIGQLEKIARAHKVQLLRGQYTQSPISGTSLVRWQLALPVSADYPTLHAFVADSLHSIDALTLEDLRLKRDTIGSTALSADLRFNLYLREGAR